jgi:hypothetical protein
MTQAQRVKATPVHIEAFQGLRRNSRILDDALQSLGPRNLTIFHQALPNEISEAVVIPSLVLKDTLVT